MARARGSFPHPIVDGSDDVDSVFSIRDGVQLSTTPASVNLEFMVELDDPDMIRMLREDQVRLRLKWRCRQTLKSGEARPRKLTDYGSKARYSVELSQSDLAGMIEAELLLVANVEIVGYRLERQHLEYGDAVFVVREGDVLGIGGSFRADVEKLYDPMNPPLESCFVFRSDDSVKTGVALQFSEDDHVIVRFKPVVFENFRALGSRPDFQIGVVMLPALIGTLTQIAPGMSDEDFSRRKWYFALQRLIDRYKIREKSPLEQAQIILGDPVAATLERQSEDEGREQ